MSKLQFWRGKIKFLSKIQIFSPLFDFHQNKSLGKNRLVSSGILIIVAPAFKVFFQKKYKKKSINDTVHRGGDF